MAWSFDECVNKLGWAILFYSLHESSASPFLNLFEVIDSCYLGNRLNVVAG